MKFLPLLFIGTAGCAPLRHPVAASAATSSPVVISRVAVISTAASPDDRRRFIKAILDSGNLEADLPEKVAGTPYQMGYFSMSAVAPEIFFIVASTPRDRNGWVALAKINAFGDGEYARSYKACEKAAKREFPGIFFRACPDWESLTYHASRIPW